MSGREFFDLVVEYRDAEKEYELLKSPGVLLKMKTRQQQIDKEIKRVVNILMKNNL